MRNAITLKEPPLIPSPTFIRHLPATARHPLPHPTTKNNNASVISESIARTIDQIQQKISDIGLAFKCEKKIHYGQERVVRKSQSSWLDEGMQECRREKMGYESITKKKRREGKEMYGSDCGQRSISKEVARDGNKENERVNQAQSNTSKGIMFGRNKLFWKESDDFNNTQASLEDCFSSVYLSKQHTEKISCSNFYSNVSTLSKDVVAIPKIFMKRKHKGKENNASFPQKIKSVRQKGQAKRLLCQLNNQIFLDEMFMTIKEWFNEHQSIKKWKQLQVQMRRAGITVGELALKSIFLINSDEESSFTRFGPDDYSVSDLVNSYCATERNWQHNILHQFNPKDLQADGFIQSQLDITNKGHIRIQDLVYYINNKLYAFYQNRHLRLIFKRLKKMNILHYNDLLHSLSQAKLT